MSTAIVVTQSTVVSETSSRHVPAGSLCCCCTSIGSTSISSAFNGLVAITMNVVVAVLIPQMKRIFSRSYDGCIETSSYPRLSMMFRGSDLAWLFLQKNVNRVRNMSFIILAQRFAKASFVYNNDSLYDNHINDSMWIHIQPVAVAMKDEKVIKN